MRNRIGWGLLVAMAITAVQGGGDEACAAVPYLLSTDDHPTASFVSFDFYVGDPDDPLNPGPIASTGPLNVNGTADVDLCVDGAGDGELIFYDTALTADSASDLFIDLGAFGTGLLDLNALRFTFVTEEIPIGAPAGRPPFTWSLDDVMMNEGGALVEINSGTAVLHDLTGALATLLPEPFVLNFAAAPAFVFFDDGLGGIGIGGTADEGPTLDAFGPELNLLVPGFDLDPFQGTTGLAGALTVRISGEAHVAVPEPASIWLAVLAAASCLFFAQRR